MIGSQISHYRITAFLGGGAMGQVYKAEDTVLRRIVALKILPPYQATELDPSERFLREARASSALDHPNICTVYEIGRADDGLQFIAMAWCDGITLQQALTKGTMSPNRAARIALQIAEGLVHAHEHGVIHRDIKPGNIMITAGDVVKIVDFGLARLADQSRLTMSGSVMGTAGYMAPERVEGKEAGAAADIWALGVVLYEMLSGRLPFAGDSNMALLKAVVDTQPRAMPELPGPIGEQLGAIVARCLRKNPGRRYGTARELAGALAEVVDSSGHPVRTVTGALPDPLDPTVTVPAQPRRRLAAPLIVVLALVASLLIPQVKSALMSLLPVDTDQPEKTVTGVVVMPFEIGEDDSLGTLLGQGLAWTLAERLSRLEAHDQDLWVVPPGDTGLPGPYGADRILTATGSRNGPALDLRLAVLDQAGDTLQMRRFADPLTNLKTWQRSQADWLVGLLRPESAGEIEERFFSGCTTIPAAFLSCQTGLGRLMTTRRGGDYAPAVADFSAAVARDSSYAMAWLGLGRAQALDSDYRDPEAVQRAVECFNRAAALDGDLAWSHVWLGHLLENTGEAEQALACYQDALAIDPVHAKALYRLGTLQRKLGRTDEAQQTFLRAAGARPDYIEPALDAGRFFYRQARYTEATGHFARGIEIAPENPWGYNLMGASLFEIGRYAEAESLLERSLQLEVSLRTLNNLSTLYYYDGRYGDAAEFSGRALEIDPDNYQMWQLRASCLWSEGHLDSARAAYEKVPVLARNELALNPGDHYVLADLASVQAYLEQKDDALEILEDLSGQEGLVPEVMFSMADTYEIMGDRDNALIWLERAVASDLSLKKVRHYPGLRNLRSDPRFAALRAAYGE